MEFIEEEFDLTGEINESDFDLSELDEEDTNIFYWQDDDEAFFNEMFGEIV
jgi:hypothetical protein